MDIGSMQNMQKQNSLCLGDNRHISAEGRYSGASPGYGRTMVRWGQFWPFPTIFDHFWAVFGLK